MNSIYNYTLDELGNYFISIGDKKFRAIQIFEWLYRNRVNSFDEMTNLSKKVIEHLKEKHNIKNEEDFVKFADFYAGGCVCPEE